VDVVGGAVSTRWVVFGAYFAVIFAIGWVSLGRTDDESDYWIAGGELGWLVGGATLAATHTSAGTFIGTLGVVHAAGWSFVWVVISIPLAYWFTAAVLAPRFTRVRRLTLPDFLGARYASRGTRAVAAAIILIAMVVYIQAQIVAGGLIGNIVFGLDPTAGMVLFTAILLVYTAVGGMIAVVYTDFLQLAIMILGAVVALPLALRNLDGLAGLLAYVDALKPGALGWGGLPTALLFTLALSFFLGSVSTPEKLVRLYAMKDMRTVRRAILLTIVVVTVVNLIVTTLGLAGIVYFPILPTGDLAMPVIARAVLPPLVGSLMLAAVTSAMMSTVDSLLIVAGSALSEDLYQNLVHPRASRRRRLAVARAGIAVVGTVPLVLTLAGFGQGQLVQFIVLLFTTLMAASFFAPVVGGVLWRRGTRQGALAAMVGGVGATALWRLYGPAHIDPVAPAFLISVALYVGVSLLTAPPPASAVAEVFGEAG
jgi:SSS family transporter